MGLSTTQRGAVAEAAIALAATKLGIVVLRPLIEGRRYDLVFDTGTRFVRVQCKWVTRHEAVLRVHIRGSVSYTHLTLPTICSV